jgi:hypothetical protein
MADNLDPEVKAAYSAIGRIGGKAGKGAAKRRTKKFYKQIAKLSVSARRKNAKKRKTKT